MTPKEYLSRYRNLGQSIDAKRMQIVQLREQAVQITRAVSPDRVQGGGERDRVSAAAARIVDAVRDLEGQIADRENARKEIEEAIGKVEDGALRVLLEYRYLAGLTWEQIAETLSYDYRWVLRLHSRALQAIESHLPPVL